MSRTVWAASSGCYSDWNIRALFETEADAQDYVAKGFAEGVSEYDLYEAGYRASVLTVYEATWSRMWKEHYDYDERVVAHHHIDDDGELAKKLTRPVVTENDTRYGVIRVECVDRDLAVKALRDRVYIQHAVRAGIG